MNVWFYIPEAHLQGSIMGSLSAVGLGDVAGSDAPEVRLVSSGGPDGGGGRLVWWPAQYDGQWTSEVASVDLPRQTWTAIDAHLAADPMLPAGRWWVGWPSGLRPDPGAWLRQRSIGGREVALNDGHGWQIPPAAALPKVHGRAGGAWCSQVRPEYLRYADLAAAVLPKFVDALGLAVGRRATGEEAVQLTISQGMDLIVAALAVNYRLNADLVGMLGLLDDFCALACLRAIYDQDDLAEILAQKKTADVCIPAG